MPITRDRAEPSFIFRCVDAAADGQKLAACLAFLDDLADFRAYKEAAIASLGLTPAAHVADVACGLGFDLVRLHRRAPQGRVVGFDVSSALLTAARRTVAGCETAALVAADAHALPCPDGTFDAVRIDRSLQHMGAPATVIAEMARITRRGGIVAASEPDWSSFSLGLDDDPAVGVIIAEWTASFRNPRIGRELAALMPACGLAPHHQHAQMIALPDWAAADRVFDIAETVRRCVSKGRLDAASAAGIVAAMVEDGDRRGFTARLVIHTVTGSKR